jgi:hypothetical protein
MKQKAPEGTDGNRRNLCQDGQSLGLQFNPRSPEYEAAVHPLDRDGRCVATEVTHRSWWSQRTDKGFARIVQGRIFSNMLYVRYVHVTNVKPVCTIQTHPVVREDVT